MELFQFTNNSLNEERVQNVLEGQYMSASADKYKFIRLLPNLLLKSIMGKKPSEILTTEMAKDIYMPVSREQGDFIYRMARVIKARTIVEFGTSFGVSTIYLAAAVRDNGGGLVIGTEVELHKYIRATMYLAEAGLSEFADIRLGDALDTLKNTPEQIDMVLLDGGKDLYLPVLDMLKPRLKNRAIVLANNISTYKKALRQYIGYVQSGTNGFESTTLPVGEGLEHSVYTGGNKHEIFNVVDALEAFAS